MKTGEPNFNQLKKIWSVKIVVDAGNLQAAAVRAKVSVSALSQTISKLEVELGRALFTKRERHLFPTSYCLDLLRKTEPAFRLLRELQADVNVDHSSEPIPSIAWLDLGISHCVPSAISIELVRRMKMKIPSIQIKLKTDRCEVLQAKVKTGELCMAIVSSYEKPKGVTSYPIYNEQLGLFAQPELYERFAGDPGLMSRSIACLSQGASGRPAYYTRFLRAIGPRMRPSVTADTYELLREVALSGVAVAILPERMAEKEGVPALIRLDGKAWSRYGKFSVYLISQLACDPDEDQFILGELRSLFS